MDSILKKVIFVCLAIVPFTAWYVSDGRFLDIWQTGAGSLFFPFITGKNILFRLLVEIAFASWVALAFTHKEYRPSKNGILISSGIFLIVLFIANIQGANVIRSMFSNFERMEGFVTHLHLFMYLIVIVSTFRTKEEWRNIFPWFVISNALVLMWAFFQQLGNPDFWFSKTFPAIGSLMSENFPIHMSGNRLDSTLGNSAYFGIYCVLFAFLYAYAITNTHKEKRVLLSLLLIANMLALYYSGTRGSILGLIGGAIIASLSYLFAQKHKAMLGLLLSLPIIFFAYGFLVDIKMLGYFVEFVASYMVVLFLCAMYIIRKDHANNAKKIAVGCIGIIAITFAVFAYAKDSVAVQGNIYLSRIANISATEATSGSRIMVWGMSYEGFKERPLLGWGQDNFQEVFAKHYNPGMYAQEPWFDRSHNVFFDWLIAAGIIGLVSYLSIFAATLYLLWKKTVFTLAQKSIITGAFTAYFIHNVFVFDNLVSYILFFTLLGYVASNLEKVKKENKNSWSEFVFSESYIQPIILFAVFTVFVYSVYKPYVANVSLIRAIDMQSLYEREFKGDFSGAIEAQHKAFDTALTISPLGKQEAREQLLTTTVNVFSLNIEGMPKEMRQSFEGGRMKLVELVAREIQEMEKEGLSDARAYDLIGYFYLSFGKYVESQKYFEKAHEAAPKKQRISFNLLQAELSLGKNKEAYQLAKETYLLDTRYEDAKRIYVAIAARTGNFADAVSTLKDRGQVIPYSGAFSPDLQGVTDKKLVNEYVKELIKAYPDQKSRIEEEYKVLVKTLK